MREIRKSGSEGGAGQNNVPFLPLSLFRCKVQFQRDNGIRDEIQPKLRSLLSKNHLLFYRVQSNEIQILRLLPGSWDLSNQE